MLHYIYSRSFISVITFMALALTAWSALPARVGARRWRWGNLVLVLLIIAAILYATLFSRAEGSTGLILTPFASLTAARIQPELYREMLMNVFLFFPLGLTLSNALPQRLSRWVRIGITTLFACLLSTVIEYTQYYYALGMAETDDVICNTLGAFIGSTSLMIAHVMEKHKERARHAMMTLTTTETQFITLIKAAVSGGNCPTANVNWPDIFALAKEQKLLPILFEAVRRTSAAEENAALFAAIKQQVIGQVLSQTMRSAEFSALYRKLRAAGLHPVVAKGQLCSWLYPLKDYRLSGDDDLYITEGEFFDCHKTLLANGLITDTPAEDLQMADEVSYTKKGSPLYIELHRHLFDSSEDAHDELNHFFADIQPVEADGLLAMPPHQHLLYLILHAYKHFVRSGIGLRQFCDIGLWARAYHSQIDWQRLHDQCASVHAATFAEAAFRIAREYLGIAFDLPAPWDNPIDVEPLLHDTLCGGVYGSNDYTRLHSSTVTLNAVKSSRDGQKSSVLASVFPRRNYMAHQYAYVKRCPLLLPVAWVQRLARYALEKHSVSHNSAAGSVRLARERIELMKLYEIIK